MQENKSIVQSPESKPCVESRVEAIRQRILNGEATRQENKVRTDAYRQFGLIASKAAALQVSFVDVAATLRANGS